MWSAQDVFLPLNTLLGRELSPGVESIERHQQMLWIASTLSVC